LYDLKLQSVPKGSQPFGRLVQSAKRRGVGFGRRGVDGVAEQRPQADVESAGVSLVEDDEHPASSQGRQRVNGLGQD